MERTKKLQCLPDVQAGVNGRKKKKARLVLDSFLNFRRLLMAACPAWWAFRFLRKGQAPPPLLLSAKRNENFVCYIFTVNDFPCRLVLAAVPLNPPLVVSGSAFVPLILTTRLENPEAEILSIVDRI